MPLVLEIHTHAAIGRTVLVAGPPLTVGSGEDVDVRLDEAAGLAAMHFAIEPSDHAAVVRDLRAPDPAPLHVDGRPMREATVHGGSVVDAGRARFGIIDVRDERHAAMYDGAPVIAGFATSVRAIAWRPRRHDGADLPAMRRALALSRLRAEPNLWAVVDPAREPKVLAMLRESDETFVCLFPERVGLETTAPHLVRLPSASRLLDQLVSGGFRKSWGVFLASAHSIDDITRALQSLLLVRDESGRRMYFRFYDPRVLRTFLAIATRHQVDRLFDAADAFLFEGSSGTLVRATRRKLPAQR